MEISRTDAARSVFPGHDVLLKVYGGEPVPVEVTDVDPDSGLITVVQNQDYNEPMVVERCQLIAD